MSDIKDFSALLPGGLGSASILADAPVGIAILTSDGRPLYANPALCEFLGYTWDELRKLNYRDVAHPDDRAAEERIAEFFAGRLPDRERERRYVRKDGTVVWGSARTSRVAAPGGTHLVIGMVTDITRRKEAEETLRAAEEQYRTIFDAAAIGITQTDADGRLLSANPAACRMLGRSREELIGRSYRDFVHEDDLGEATSWFAELADRRLHRYDAMRRFVRPDGNPVEIHLTVTGVRRDGHLSSVVGLLEDVTDRHRAEKDLRESEARLRSIFEANLIGMVYGDFEGHIFDANDEYLRIIGYSRDDLARGLRWSDLTAPEFHEIDRERNLEARQRGACTPYEKQYIRKDGTRAWVVVGYVLLGTAREKSVAFVLDIEERKRAEEALRAAEERYRTIFDTAALGIAQADVDGLYTDVNPAFCGILGRKKEDVLGKPIGEFIHPDDLSRNLFLLEDAKQGKTDQYQLTNRFLRPDGSAVVADVLVTSIRDSGGLRHFIGLIEDITEKTRLEAEFRQAQKMEAIGRLAGGVAHDFNNLLTVIQGYGEGLRSSLAKDDPNGAGVEEILKAAERAGALTRQLLAFSRRQVLEPRVIRLDAVVANMEKMLRRLIGEDVGLVIARKVGLGCVKADPGQIEQILMNLAVNARDAMPEGGRLTIETADADLDETFANEPGHPKPGPYVMLAITDTGVGMNAETQAHLFEPFFTTKDPGKGTGLGLATVYGIVKQSGGYIWASSTLGSGTAIRIYLPRVDGEAAAAGSARAAIAPGGHETILVVEDEAAVRKMAVSALASKGYTVLDAGGAADGLDVAERLAGRLDLLLTDVIMPGMSGRELAERLVSLRPGLKVLFMSGYVDDTIASHGVLEPGIHLLKKPFAPASLAREVRKVLDGQNNGGSS